MGLNKYKKFKGAGLPIMDYSKNEMHYLNFFKYKNNKGKEKIDVIVSETLSEALGFVVNEEFYYGFNTMVVKYDDEGNEYIEVAHSHAHDFESVVKEVYFNPHVFSIDDEDRKFYSDQQYKFLMKIQSYLKAIKREDISFDATIDDVNNLALSSDAVAFREYTTKNFLDDNKARLIIEKKRKYFISLKDEEDENSKDRYLLADNNGYYLGLIEVVKKKCMKIDDIRDSDVDIKLEGFRSLKALKKHLKDFYSENYPDFNEHSEIIINTVKVIRKFK